MTWIALVRGRTLLRFGTPLAIQIKLRDGEVKMAGDNSYKPGEIVKALN